MKRATLNIRALRLPFATASLLPCIFGAIAAVGPVHPGFMALAICAAVGCHLSANLVNDYGDHITGVDWLDQEHYVFFGGSKLIQQGQLSAGFYLRAAIFFGVVGLGSVLLATFLGRPLALIVFAPVVFLAWSYSLPPLRLSYHRLGELTILLLFGPATVLGAAYLQSGTAPETSTVVLSLAFGLITTALLVVNEVPDAATDASADKNTLVNWIGPEHGYVLFAALTAAAFACMMVGVAMGWLSGLALLNLLLLWPAWVVGRGLKDNYKDKHRLKRTSRQATGMHLIFCLTLILGLIK